MKKLSVSQTRPTVRGAYEKNELKQALKFARSFSKTFKSTRVLVENYPDASGVTVWTGVSRTHDNKEVILFLGGKRKKAIA